LWKLQSQFSCGSANPLEVCDCVFFYKLPKEAVRFLVLPSPHVVAYRAQCALYGGGINIKIGPFITPSAIAAIQTFLAQMGLGDLVVVDSLRVSVDGIFGAIPFQAAPVFLFSLLYITNTLRVDFGDTPSITIPATGSNLVGLPGLVNVKQVWP
jgi:hypothetical protein